jgi:hypothetical protein
MRQLRMLGLPNGIEPVKRKMNSKSVEPNDSRIDCRVPRERDERTTRE